jgi:hypothetical protein
VINGCEHRQKRKQIGFGADGKTYCVDCGAETSPFSFMDLMREPRQVNERAAQRALSKQPVAAEGNGTATATAAPVSGQGETKP